MSTRLPGSQGLPGASPRPAGQEPPGTSAPRPPAGGTAQRGAAGLPPDFLLSSRGWQVRAWGGSVLQPVLAPDPRSAAASLLAALRRADQDSGRTHVLCGLIPFDLSEPAYLRLTDHVSWHPRRWGTPQGEQATPSTPAPATASTTASAAPGEKAAQPRPAGRDGAGAAPGEGSLPPAPPEDSAFTEGVRHVLDHLGREGLEKVVLSRYVDIALPASTDPTRLAALLVEGLMSDRHRGADIYCATDAQGRTWLGASPEVVADTHDGTFLTTPLAGSLPRTIPRAEALSRLAASHKDLREHSLVVDHIRAALGGVVEDLQVPGTPCLLATDTMWHLGTRITGRLSPGTSSLEAALAIHPTPAVCGVPAPQAATLIRRLEGQSRQFYSGLVGWTDSSGDGRWSLVLRGARVERRCIRIQAGAGIVEGSVPELEHAETGAKLTTMLNQLHEIRGLGGLCGLGGPERGGCSP